MDDNLEIESAGRERAVRARERARAVRRNGRRAAKKPVKTLQDFGLFIRSEWIVGLAIGLVLGTQFKTLVDQLINSFISPILGLILPGKGDLSSKVFTLDVPALDKAAIFHYGAFLNVFISFITVVAVIYVIVKSLKIDKVHTNRSEDKG